MNEIKCECGHVNPFGTILCESCGKSLSGTEEWKPSDMRYEGSARRSQTYNRTIVDKIWNFFSSVKVAIWLLVITLIVSAAGTILPQKMYIPPSVSPETFYGENYGWFGKVYYALGLHELYSQWWYMLLLASIGVSLCICSLDRAVPLYRALKSQGVRRHESFLKSQRLFGVTKGENLEEAVVKLKENLLKKRYRIREEGNAILAEKGRFSRWGPYVNHVGLIIFLFGAMLRFFPGMYVDEVLAIKEGERKEIPGTGGKYFLENKQFIHEVYDKNEHEAFAAALEKKGQIDKNFQTDVVLYKRSGDTVPGGEVKLKKEKEESIRVNEPLKFDDYALYQMDFRPILTGMSFLLIDKETDEELGEVRIDLDNPESRYDLGNGYAVEILDYFPDFDLNEEGLPVTRSKAPHNPAFVFEMKAPDRPDGEISFVAVQQTMEPYGNNKYKMQFSGIETKNVSVLTVRKDLTLWIFALGGLVFLVGLALGSYWNHRRIWIQKREQEIWLAAHTNKNWFGFKRELKAVLAGTGINEPQDRHETKGESR